MFITVVSLAQNGNKTKLFPSDYNKWSSLQSNNLSPNGDWLSYYLRFDEHTDTLFLRPIKEYNTHLTLSFPEAKNAIYSPEGNWFGCILPGLGMSLVNLDDGKKQIISNLVSFDFTHDDSYLIGRTNTDSILIRDLDKGSDQWLIGIKEYKLHPEKNSIATIKKTGNYYEVQERGLLNYRNDIELIFKTRNPLQQLIWDNSGKALVFLEVTGLNEINKPLYKIHQFLGNNGKTRHKEWMPGKEKGHYLEAKYLTNVDIRVRGEGKAIQINLSDESSEVDLLEKSPLFKLWNSKEINWSIEDLWQEKKSFSKKAVWLPDRDTIIVLGNAIHPESILTPDNKNLISFTRLQSGPQFKHKFKCSVQVTDLEDGKTITILERQVPSSIHVSPSGNYIAYFKEKNWWAYHFKTNSHQNLTENLNSTFHIERSEYSGGEPFELAGWTLKDKEVLIYDKYDIWVINLITGKSKRLTNGKIDKVTFRIENTQNLTGTYGELPNQKWFPNIEGINYDLNNNLILKATGDDLNTGYFLLKPNGTISRILYGRQLVGRVEKAAKKEIYNFATQSFEAPVSLWAWDDTHLFKIVQTNEQHNGYYWGKSELLRYKGLNGQDLRGALYYPSQFDPSKKYPMVVWIYERKSKELNEYVNPSYFNPDGFNITNYTQDGYFVFLPDILYEFNQPGISAVQCVEAGVRAVLDKGIVAAERVGLTGHSFGGYETAFIVTQSNMFATAVAGASVTNLVSFYHHVGKVTNVPEMWRFEEQQWRYKNSFYENPNAYLNNSPLHHAKNVNIPLLLWTGGKDDWIDWYQSVEMYLALSRLGREAELLIYPKESHALMKNESQTHLTKYIHNWFNRYLKE